MSCVWCHTRCLMTSHPGPVSDSAPTTVHRHWAPLIQSFLRWHQQDGQPAVGHLTLFHSTHQLNRKQEVKCLGWDQHQTPGQPSRPTTDSPNHHAWLRVLKQNGLNQSACSARSDLWPLNSDPDLQSSSSSPHGQASFVALGAEPRRAWPQTEVGVFNQHTGGAITALSLSLSAFLLRQRSQPRGQEHC